MVFQPRLDAFRGLCISAVFLTHTFFLDCGWVGVQAFFVLSGYLITGILLESKQGNSGARGYFGNFYARRALRIFPVYFGYVAIAIAAMHMIDTPLASSLRDRSDANAPYLLTYTANLFFAFNSLRFTALDGHLWSLSIEEQFYFVWPLLVLLVSRRRLPLLCLCLVAAGPVLRALEYAWIDPVPEQRPNAGYFITFLTLSHIDAFALGALLNFRDEALVQRIVHAASRWVPAAALALGLGMLLLGRFVHYNLGWTSLGWPPWLPYFYAAVWGYTLLNALFFVCLANVDAWPAFMDNAGLRRLGRISYGFYIFHKPVIWLSRLALGVQDMSGLANAGAALLAFAVTWAAAEVSFRWFETPFLNLKRLFTPHPRGAVAAESARSAAGLSGLDNSPLREGQ